MSILGEPESLQAPRWEHPLEDVIRRVHPGYFTCPVLDCHRGPDAHSYVARVTGPDGRARAVWACVDHLPLLVGQVLSEIRLEPFE